MIGGLGRLFIRLFKQTTKTSGSLKGLNLLSNKQQNPTNLSERSSGSLKGSKLLSKAPAAAQATESTATANLSPLAKATAKIETSTATANLFETTVKALSAGEPGKEKAIFITAATFLYKNKDYILPLLEKIPAGVITAFLIHLINFSYNLISIALNCITTLLYYLYKFERILLILIVGWFLVFSFLHNIEIVFITNFFSTYFPGLSVNKYFFRSLSCFILATLFISALLILRFINNRFFYIRAKAKPTNTADTALQNNLVPGTAYYLQEKDSAHFSSVSSFPQDTSLTAKFLTSVYFSIVIFFSAVLGTALFKVIPKIYFSSNNFSTEVPVVGAVKLESLGPTLEEKSEWVNILFTLMRQRQVPESVINRVYLQLDISSISNKDSLLKQAYSILDKELAFLKEHNTWSTFFSENYIALCFAVPVVIGFAYLGYQVYLLKANVTLQQQHLSASFKTLGNNVSKLDDNIKLVAEQLHLVDNRGKATATATLKYLNDFNERINKVAKDNKINLQFIHDLAKLTDHYKKTDYSLLDTLSSNFDALHAAFQNDEDLSPLLQELEKNAKTLHNQLIFHKKPELLAKYNTVSSVNKDLEDIITKSGVNLQEPVPFIEAITPKLPPEATIKPPANPLEPGSPNPTFFKPDGYVNSFRCMIGSWFH